MLHMHHIFWLQEQVQTALKDMEELAAANGAVKATLGLVLSFGSRLFFVSLSVMPTVENQAPRESNTRGKSQPLIWISDLYFWYSLVTIGKATWNSGDRTAFF